MLLADLEDGGFWEALGVGFSLEHIDGCQDGVGVLGLVFATQLAMERSQAARLVIDATLLAELPICHLPVVLGEEDGGSLLLGLGLEHGGGLGLCLADDYGYTYFYNTRFFACDLFARMAEELGMVEADVGDERQYA